MIYKSFGIGGFSIIFNLIVIGLTLSFDKGYKKLIQRSLTFILSAVWLSIFSFHFFEDYIFSGLFGYELGTVIINFSGDLGLLSFLLFGFIAFLVINLKITPNDLKHFLKNIFKNIGKKIKSDNIESTLESDETNEEINENTFEFKNTESVTEPTIKNHSVFEEKSEK